MADRSVDGGASPLWLNPGDHSWQLIAGTLVGLQTMPGLVILYSGIVKNKWAANSAFMGVYAFAATLICWVLWGYKMSFGEKLIPLVGIPGPTLGYRYLFGQAELPSTVHHYKNGTIEMDAVKESYGMADMVLFQFFFAAITVVLLAGSVLGRMSHTAWMLFVPLWITFSYTVGAFSLWGGGFLFQWGVIDYAGGYVIHVSSGVAGYVAAYWVGPRLAEDRRRYDPNDLKMVVAGAGLLWLGWSGFNGGATFSANLVSGLAILNTHVCTAASLLTWTALDVLFLFLRRRMGVEVGQSRGPSVIGAVQGMMTGLVAITPAAGFVAPWAALVMGFVISFLTWFSMVVVHRLLPCLTRVDDTLGVLYTHFAAGIFGGLAVGFLADPTLLTYMNHVVRNSNGVFYGGNGGMQLLKQLVGACFIIGWNVVITSLILWVLKFCLGTLQFNAVQLERGDDGVQCEEYTFWGNDEPIDFPRFRQNQNGGQNQNGVRNQNGEQNHSVEPDMESNNDTELRQR